MNQTTPRSEVTVHLGANIASRKNEDLDRYWAATKDVVGCSNIKVINDATIGVDMIVVRTLGIQFTRQQLEEAAAELQERLGLWVTIEATLIAAAQVTAEVTH